MRQPGEDLAARRRVRRMARGARAARARRLGAGRVLEREHGPADEHGGDVWTGRFGVHLDAGRARRRVA